LLNELAALTLTVVGSRVNSSSLLATIDEASSRFVEVDPPPRGEFSDLEDLYQLELSTFRILPTPVRFVLPTLKYELDETKKNKLLVDIALDDVLQILNRLWGPIISHIKVRKDDTRLLRITELVDEFYDHLLFEEFVIHEVAGFVPRKLIVEVGVETYVWLPTGHCFLNHIGFLYDQMFNPNYLAGFISKYRSNSIERMHIDCALHGHRLPEPFDVDFSFQYTEKRADLPGRIRFILDDSDVELSMPSLD
jgi:hypothetical protein